MFDVTVVREFCAAHQLRLHDGQMEPLHGHNWRVRVTVTAPKLDSIGVVIDFHELERMLDEVIGTMHNALLNELEAFASINPSAENVAAHVAGALRLPASVRLTAVEVWETAQNSAVFRPL